MSKVDVSNSNDFLSPLLLETHDNIQSFVSRFKEVFTKSIQTEDVNEILQAGFKLVSSLESSTNMVYLLFCLHVYKGVNVFKLSLEELDTLPKNQYLKALFCRGIISITTKASTTTPANPQSHEQQQDAKNVKEPVDEGKPKSYNSRTNVLKRQFTSLIQDIQHNDVLKNQLFNPTHLNSLHVLSTDYERWREKAVSLIKDADIGKHLHPDKMRETYEQKMNSLKREYEDLIENYYIPVYLPSQTLGKYKNKSGHYRSKGKRLKIWSTNTTPPPSHTPTNESELQYSPNELMERYQQQRPGTAPPDISCIHDDMPMFSD